MRGALKWQGLFSCNRKNIYENRLTFANFCGIIKLPLEKIAVFSIDLYLNVGGRAYPPLITLS